LAGPWAPRACCAGRELGNDWEQRCHKIAWWTTGACETGSGNPPFVTPFSIALQHEVRMDLAANALKMNLQQQIWTQFEDEHGDRLFHGPIARRSDPYFMTEC
jgi:hypothetical protein